MQLGDLKLSSASFEVRFAKAYLFWDRPGALALEIQKKLPTMTLVEVGANKLHFHNNVDTELLIELDKAHITFQSPKRNLADAVAPIEALVSIVCDILLVEDFTRIGTRTIYSKDFTTIGDATKALAQTNILSFPPGHHFGHDQPPKTCDVVVRWEGDSFGTTVRLKTESVKIEFKPPPEIEELKPLDKEVHRLILDIDYYSVATVLHSQFRVEDWINKVMHIVNRDTRTFLGMK